MESGSQSSAATDSDASSSCPQRQKHIPIDELKNMNPAMRNALIQSVSMGGPGQTGVRPPGPMAGAVNPGLDQGMQHRIQQQQALHRQMQRNVTQAGQAGPQSTARSNASSADAFSKSRYALALSNGPLDGRRSVGPGQQGPRWTICTRTTPKQAAHLFSSKGR